MVKYLSVNEVAELLGVHPNHIRRLMYKKAIPHYKRPGVGVRFDLDEIKKWMEEGYIGTRNWDEEAERITGR